MFVSAVFLLRTRIGAAGAAFVAALCFVPALYGQTSVSLEPSVASPAPVGTVVTWAARVHGDVPESYRFRFTVRGLDQSRRVVKDFGPDNTLEWAAGEHEGLYVVEVTARNKDTGGTAMTASAYQVLSNVVGNQPAVLLTAHPLVFLYSAPVCPLGSKMIVYFLSPDHVLQNAPAKDCDGIFSMNFYIAGLRASTFYYVKHIIDHGGSYTEGPVLSFTSGAIPIDLPAHSKLPEGSSISPQRVVLAASLFTNFVATDLDGNIIWYYPHTLLFLTNPDSGGHFFAIHEDHEGDQSKQIVRLFDLSGTTVLETNAACINEQLVEQGKRRIGAFHHEARRLSDGNILVLASVEQILQDVQGAGPVNVLGDMIVVLNRDLNVVWTWDAFDHLDVRRRATQGEKCNRDACPPLFESPQANDWTHANSVTETPDGNLLVSLRSQDWVIKIDYQHGRGTGSVIWKLGKDGDFSIVSSDPDPWFSHQHDAEFESDGLLTIFDNGNVRREADENARSRGQVFRLNEQNMVAELVLNADLGFYAFALGSAQRLENGNYFFDVGFRVDATGISVEVNPSGTPIYAIQSTAPEYRTFRMRDLYTP
jgi:hypothetical protein